MRHADAPRLRALLVGSASLEAAHEKGIIHRDLKPGNIMVTPDGAVKVLDVRYAHRAARATAGAAPGAHR